MDMGTGQDTIFVVALQLYGLVSGVVHVIWPWWAPKIQDIYLVFVLLVRQYPKLEPMFCIFWARQQFLAMQLLGLGIKLLLGPKRGVFSVVV